MSSPLLNHEPGESCSNIRNSPCAPFATETDMDLLTKPSWSPNARNDDLGHHGEEAVSFPSSPSIESKETRTTHLDSSNSHSSCLLSDSTPMLHSVEEIYTPSKEDNKVDEIPVTQTTAAGGSVPKSPSQDVVGRPHESNHQRSINTSDETVDRRNNPKTEMPPLIRQETEDLQEELGEKGLPCFIEFQNQTHDDDTQSSSLLSLGEHSYLLDLQYQNDERVLQRNMEVFEEAFQLIKSSSEYAESGKKIPEDLFLAVFRAVQRRNARRFREEDEKRDRLLRDARRRLQSIPPTEEDFDEEDEQHDRVLQDAKERLQSIPPLEESDDDTLSDLAFATTNYAKDGLASKEITPVIQPGLVRDQTEQDLETVGSFSVSKSNGVAPSQVPLMKEEAFLNTKHLEEATTRPSWIEWELKISAAIKIQALARRALVGSFQPSEELRRERARIRAATKIQAVARRNLVGRFRPARIHAAVKIQSIARRSLAQRYRASMTLSTIENIVLDTETPVIACDTRTEEPSNILTDDGSDITYEEINDDAGTAFSAGDCVSYDFSECVGDISFEATKSIQSQALSYDEISCDETSHLDYNYDALTIDYEEFSVDDSLSTEDPEALQFEYKVIQVQTWVRKLAAVQGFRQKKRQILVLQAFSRMLLARSRFCLQQSASTRIRTWMQGRLAVLLLENLRRAKASTVIQACVRGRSVRFEFQRKRKASTMIQAHARSTSARKDFYRKQQAVKIIQACVRSFLERAALVTRHGSARIIQRFVRGLQAKRELYEMVRATRIIQRMWRAKQAVRILCEASATKTSLKNSPKGTRKSKTVAQKWKKKLRKILKKPRSKASTSVGEGIGEDESHSKGWKKKRVDTIRSSNSHGSQEEDVGMNVPQEEDRKNRVRPGKSAPRIANQNKEQAKSIAPWERRKLRSRVASTKILVGCEDSFPAKIQEARINLNPLGLTTSTHNSTDIAQLKTHKIFTGRKIVKKKGLNLDSMWS